MDYGYGYGPLSCTWVYTWGHIWPWALQGHIRGYCIRLIGSKYLCNENKVAMNGKTLVCEVVRNKQHCWFNGETANIC